MELLQFCCWIWILYWSLVIYFVKKTCCKKKICNVSLNSTRPLKSVTLSAKNRIYYFKGCNLLNFNVFIPSAIYFGIGGGHMVSEWVKTNNGCDMVCKRGLLSNPLGIGICCNARKRYIYILYVKQNFTDEFHAPFLPYSDTQPYILDFYFFKFIHCK